MASILPVAGSPPTGFWVTVTTHPNVVAMKQAVSGAFEYLKQLCVRLGQNIVWAWRALVDGGAVRASLAIEAASGVARAVLPDKVVDFGRTAALHGRSWWLTIRGAITAAEHEAQNQKNEAEKAQLRTERDQAITQKQAMDDHQRTSTVSFEVEKTRLMQLISKQQTELNSLQEKNKTLEQGLKTQTSRAEKAESEREEFRQQVEALKNDQLLNPERQALADALNKFENAKAVNSNVAEAYEEVIQRADNFYEKWKGLVKEKFPNLPYPELVSGVVEAFRSVSLLANQQMNIEDIIKTQRPDVYEELDPSLLSTNQS